MTIQEGPRLLVHLRTVEACRELTAAIAALASSETVNEVASPPSTGVPPPFRAPEEYRLHHLLGNQGVVIVDAWLGKQGAEVPFRAYSVSVLCFQTLSKGAEAVRQSQCCCLTADAGELNGDITHAEAQATLLVLKVGPP